MSERSNWLVRRFILWALKRDRHPVRVVTFGGSFEFWRWHPFWRDEFRSREKVYNRPPWWRPFNILLHCWAPGREQIDAMHDHPRWSITICLRGRIIEHTPWTAKVLSPGCVEIRSRKAIHEFSVPAGYRGKTWTLFIVGRRNYRQNTYRVTSR
jgi:hypothetical protein